MAVFFLKVVIISCFHLSSYFPDFSFCGTEINLPNHDYQPVSIEHFSIDHKPCHFVYMNTFRISTKFVDANTQSCWISLNKKSIFALHIKDPPTHTELDKHVLSEGQITQVASSLRSALRGTDARLINPMD